MALAFHSALSDGALGSDEVEDIKAGLRAALAAAPTTQPAPQQEATEALARAEYYIDNPSAWSSFDQRISDDISAVTNALRAALAALNDAATSLETIARIAGRTTYGTPPIETNMETPDEIRSYAAARAWVVRAAQEGQ